MSKWIGEGEKTVRTMFAVACYRQPAVVFLDEVDSLLTQRSSDENEASRRIKTEFLVQLDGAGSNHEAQVVIVGATNRPEELDEAARRRFVKRLYIPLPNLEGRRQLFQNLLCGAAGNLSSLSASELESLARHTKGFSGADLQSLCQDAAMGPIRDLKEQFGQVDNLSAAEVPPMQLRHFQTAMRTVKATVSPAELTRYLDWNAQYGSDQNVEEPT
jgi:fidgetin-like protein 1